MRQALVMTSPLASNHGSNALGKLPSYATAYEFESPQILAMNRWAGAYRIANFSLGGRSISAGQRLAAAGSVHDPLLLALDLNLPYFSYMHPYRVQLFNQCMKHGTCDNDIVGIDVPNLR